jgi:hypothetical protein
MLGYCIFIRPSGKVFRERREGWALQKRKKMQQTDGEKTVKLPGSLRICGEQLCDTQEIGRTIRKTLAHRE